MRMPRIVIVFVWCTGDAEQGLGQEQTRGGLEMDARSLSANDRSKTALPKRGSGHPARSEQAHQSC